MNLGPAGLDTLRVKVESRLLLSAMKCFLLPHAINMKAQPEVRTHAIAI
jgi:hypothetical protein